MDGLFKEIKMIKLLNVDCEKYMSELEDKSFYLGSADPVYGINGNSHRKNKSSGKIARSINYHAALWDQPITSTNYFEQLRRVTRHQIIFGGNYFEELVGTPFKTPRRHELQNFLSEYPKGWILWDKCNGTTGFNDYELIYTTFDFDSFVYTFMWNGFMQGRSMNDGGTMQSKKHLNEKRIHPTQKPVAIYDFLFHRFCGPKCSVLSTHVGSGSDAIAAYKAGINFTGCEIDGVYYNDALTRFTNFTNQITLF